MIFSIIAVSYIRYLQHAGKNIASAFVHRRINFVMAVAARHQGSSVRAKAPLEFGSGVRLNFAHHFGRIVNIVSHFIIFMQNDGTI